MLVFSLKLPVVERIGRGAEFGFDPASKSQDLAHWHIAIIRLLSPTITTRFFSPAYLQGTAAVPSRQDSFRHNLIPRPPATHTAAGVVYGRAPPANLTSRYQGVQQTQFCHLNETALWVRGVDLLEWWSGPQSKFTLPECTSSSSYF